MKRRYQAGQDHVVGYDPHATACEVCGKPSETSGVSIK